MSDGELQHTLQLSRAGIVAEGAWDWHDTCPTAGNIKCFKCEAMTT